MLAFNWAPHLILMIAMLVMCTSQSSTAQEFKIETAIYAGDAKTPVAQNVTLFQAGLIVDLKIDSATPPNVIETKIYDSKQKVVVLLDHDRNVRLEISNNRLLQMVEGLRRDISQKKHLQFLVNEAFTETHEVNLSQIRLNSPTIRYRVEGQRPTDASRLKIHGEFLDVFTWLKASDPNGFPPFARMKLNESIKKMGWIPSTVEVEMESNALVTRGIKMKSTHVLIDGLSKEDTEKVTVAKNQWLGYPAVNLLQFRGLAKKPTGNTADAETAIDQLKTTK